MSRAPAAARRGRRGPARPVRTGPWLRREIELDVGPVAAGGHCVARHEGRVVFVRHALPGERVVALVTEDRGGGFCRADAVRVLTASADRVEPPCPHAGPGRCGGCDWQQASADAQRALKAAVVREQLARLAGLPDVPVTVEALPGGLLGWRTRVTYAVDAAGRPGLQRARCALRLARAAQPRAVGGGAEPERQPRRDRRAPLAQRDRPFDRGQAGVAGLNGRAGTGARGAGQQQRQIAAANWAARPV